jgi:hypothetical protein
VAQMVDTMGAGRKRRGRGFDSRSNITVPNTAQTLSVQTTFVWCIVCSIFMSLHMTGQLRDHRVALLIRLCELYSP